MNYFQKQVRQDVKRGITIEGSTGKAFIVASGAKFSNEKGAELSVLLTVKGPAFKGRIQVKKAKGDEGIPGVEPVYYLNILKRKGWFYECVQSYSIHPTQLTAVLDAVVMGTGQVETV